MVFDYLRERGDLPENLRRLIGGPPVKSEAELKRRLLSIRISDAIAPAADLGFKFAETLGKAREAAGLTQAFVGRFLKPGNAYPDKVVSAWETGARRMRLDEYLAYRAMLMQFPAARAVLEAAEYRL